MAAPGAWTFTNGSRSDMLGGVVNIGTDTYKVALVTSTSNIGASSTTWAGVTNEVSNANGYTTGGVSVTMSKSGTTTVTATWATDPSWTATGAGIVARWAVLYEVAGNVLCYCLLDSAPADVTVAAGNTLTVQKSGSGIFTLA